MSKRAAARALLAGLIGLCLSGSVLAARGGHSGHSGGRSGHFAGSGGFHHGGHVHHRVFIGGAIYAPLYYPPPYYYPPTYYYPPPVQYVEPYPAPSAPQSSYWYYCPDSGAYYPYVQQCPSGWQQVTPQPPS